MIKWKWKWKTIKWKSCNWMCPFSCIFILYFLCLYLILFPLSILIDFPQWKMEMPFSLSLSKILVMEEKPCMDMHTRRQGEHRERPPPRNWKIVVEKWCYVWGSIFSNNFPKLVKNSIFDWIFIKNFSNFPNNLLFPSKRAKK